MYDVKIKCKNLQRSKDSLKDQRFFRLENDMLIYIKNIYVKNYLHKSNF